ncbi:MAG: electron transport complex subunit RsxB [Gammaproteobacteria bacterium]
MAEYALIADKIDALLPQTQCRQCSFPGCRPYATAIAIGEADINQCPPGGDATIAALAKLLGRDSKPLNPEHGILKPRMLAIIDEARCIGCTLCLQACPVDAILGASQQMHTVILNECTGCELCVAPCPIDCIDMVPLQENSSSRIEAREFFTQTERVAQQQQQADVARKRYEFRLQRLEREKLERVVRHAQKKAALRQA